MSEPRFGMCPYCGFSLTAGHSCFGMRKPAPPLTPPPLTESDVRRIVREELDRASSTSSEVQS